MSDGSIFEQLKAKRREITEHLTADIDIPGYDGTLVGRYRVLDAKETGQIGKRARKDKDEGERALAMAVGSVVAACEGLYFRQAEGAELKPLDPGNTGEAATYASPELGAALGFDADNARSALFEVFAHNESAILEHAMVLNRWMGNTNRDVSNDFLGG